jgi:starch phosphorylase
VRPVAYFSAEFGLHESLPIYSGGLGVLAGDHLKSASDLDVPLVGIGLFYSRGYFAQRLNARGWQFEEDVVVDMSKLPLAPALDPKGNSIHVEIETRSGVLAARVFKLHVGRNILLLLDSNVPSNLPEDQQLTAHLYGGDGRTRIRQELLLGVGGVRALRALGIDPGVIHLNEGHSAFAVFEFIHDRMQAEGLTFDEVLPRVAHQVVFTTHTPVPAGHDRFPADLVEEHLGPLRQALGLSPERLLALGRIHPGDAGEQFCMTVLGLKTSRKTNGVSALHGHVSRAMWSSLWPGGKEDDVPIGHITNGVHVPSWLAVQMHALYTRHLGADWVRRRSEPRVWDAIENVDDAEMWETHQVLKARLIDFCRRRSLVQCERLGEPDEVVEQARRALHPNVLTLGFGRRFATYKRAALLWNNVERLVNLITDLQRPVQLIFTGKAHPLDDSAKHLLQRVVQLHSDLRLAGKVVFVEDYDINVARHLVQGVDVWLNTPRRPLEACGTSGQKVVLNGGLNLSTLDGWWAEAYDGSNGFAVGRGEMHRDTRIQDERDAEALYQTLEQEVIPLYYDRNHDGLPRAWLARMKRAIRTLGWRFNADRMVIDYVHNCYLPAAGGVSCDFRGRSPLSV